MGTEWEQIIKLPTSSRPCPSTWHWASAGWAARKRSFCLATPHESDLREHKHLITSLESLSYDFCMYINLHVRTATSGRPYLPHPPSSCPIRKAHRVTPGQTIVTPGFKSPRHSGSDASCFEVVANFESCP